MNLEQEEFTNKKSIFQALFDEYARETYLYKAAGFVLNFPFQPRHVIKNSSHLAFPQLRSTFGVWY